MCCYQAHPAGLHKQNVQEAGVAAGAGSAASCCCDIAMLHVHRRRKGPYLAELRMQVLKFAQDLGLEEVEVKDVGCLGDALMSPAILLSATPACSDSPRNALQAVVAQGPT